MCACMYVIGYMYVCMDICQSVLCGHVYVYTCVYLCICARLGECAHKCVHVVSVYVCSHV